MAKVPIALCYSPFQYHWVVRALFDFWVGMRFTGSQLHESSLSPLNHAKTGKVEGVWNWQRLDGRRRKNNGGFNSATKKAQKKKTFHYSDWFINITFSSWALWVWYGIIIFPKLKPVYDPNNQALTKLALQHSLDKVSKHPNIVENVEKPKTKKPLCDMWKAANHYPLMIFVKIA